jgi:hypothetical protein
MTTTREEHQSLWLLTIAPAIWGGHFLASYIAASVWCSRFSGDGTLGPIPQLVAALTVLALAGIALVGWGGWQRHSYGELREPVPHDEDTPEDRHRFLGLATLLLAGLSAVATMYVAAAASFFGTCR